jgi:hypothetical protein
MSSYSGTIGNGVSYNILGSEYDLVEFCVEGQRIAIDRIRDGDLRPLYPPAYPGMQEQDRENFSSRYTMSAAGVVYLVAVRHGREHDLVYGYAIIEKRIVIRSPRWRDLTPGVTVVSVAWREDKTILISQRGAMSFDCANKIWTASAGHLSCIEGVQKEIMVD